MESLMKLIFAPSTLIKKMAAIWRRWMMQTQCCRGRDGAGFGKHSWYTCDNSWRIDNGHWTFVDEQSQGVSLWRWIWVCSPLVKHREHCVHFSVHPHSTLKEGVLTTECMSAWRDMALVWFASAVQLFNWIICVVIIWSYVVITNPDISRYQRDMALVQVVFALLFLLRATDASTTDCQWAQQQSHLEKAKSNRKTSLLYHLFLL